MRRRDRRTSLLAPPRPVELTLVAEFSAPWSSPADEAAAIAAKTWHPATIDLRAVANTPNQRGKLTEVVDVSDLKSLLDAIRNWSVPNNAPETTPAKERPKAGIGRLNIISHGGAGGFGLKGKVLPASAATPHGDVSWESIQRATARLSDEVFDELTLAWLNGNTDQYEAAGRLGLAYRQIIRGKLAPGAEVWLITCHGGAVGGNSVLVKEMAKTFNRVVRAYEDQIWYSPVVEKGRIIARNRTSVGENGRDGRGYYCWEKVPPELAGEHLKGAREFQPTNAYPDEPGDPDGDR